MDLNPIEQLLLISFVNSYKNFNWYNNFLSNLLLLSYIFSKLIKTKLFTFKFVQKLIIFLKAFILFSVFQFKILNLELLSSSIYFEISDWKTSLKQVLKIIDFKIFFKSICTYISILFFCKSSIIFFNCFKFPYLLYIEVCTSFAITSSWLKISGNKIASIFKYWK